MKEGKGRSGAYLGLPFATSYARSAYTTSFGRIVGSFIDVTSLDFARFRGVFGRGVNTIYGCVVCFLHFGHRFSLHLLGNAAWSIEVGLAN